MLKNKQKHKPQPKTVTNFFYMENIIFILHFLLFEKNPTRRTFFAQKSIAKLPVLRQEQRYYLPSTKEEVDGLYTAYASGFGL